MENRIKEIREHKGLKQVDLAIKVGISQSNLSFYEKGGRCSRHTAERIAGAMGRTIENVFPGIKFNREA